MEHFINKLTEIFEDANPETIKPEKKYREIAGYSSLSAFLVIGMIKEEYNVNFTANDFRKSETIEDLFMLLMSKNSILF